MSAQALSTAARGLAPSVFLGVSGVYTGINSGRNLSLTGGLDIAFLPGRKFQPALEYRGTFALDQGVVAGEKNNLGGVRVTMPLRRFRPYADGLFGRGEINYLGIGLEVPGKPIYYLQSSSNVFSVGAGVDARLSRCVSFKVDVQAQRYATPVTVSAHALATVGTLGLVYTYLPRPYGHR
jgi:hypothetical protein